MLYYNIHNTFRFRVNSNNRKFLNHIDKEFYFFKSEGGRRPDMIINIGKFRPDNKDCSIVNHQYYVKKNYLYCKDSYKVVKWEVEIKGIENGPIVVNFDGNYLSDSFLCRYIIEPLMRIRMNEKGYAFIHSSGVSDGKNAFLFGASKGVAKTSTILNLVGEGGIFLSDDFTILSRNGTVYSYPTTIHLFQYNIKAVPIVQKKLKASGQIEMRTKDLLYKLSLGYGSLPLNVDVADIFGSSKVGTKYPLKGFLFVEKSSENRITVEKMKASDLAKQIVAINKIETFNFLDYMLAYSTVFPNNKLEAHWKITEDNVSKGLKGKPVYKIRVPKVYTGEVLETIKQILVKNGYRI
jgi:hypothetical protein